jgi:multidrug resistance protein
MGTGSTEADPRSVAVRRRTLGLVFTTILIDFIGFSVLIPVLPIYMERLGASSMQVGLILALYAAAQLVFLPAWGWLSDRIGRRPVLLVSLFGTGLSFLLLAAAHSVAMVYAARVLAGFFAASIGTAQAVVTDVAPIERRAQDMGLIGAAFGLGFVIGPALGGALSKIDLLAPFYGIALVAFVNLVLACFFLPESRPAELRVRNWSGLGRTLVPSPIRLVAALHDRRIGYYLYLFFQLFTAFAALEAMFTLYLSRRFGLGPAEAGWIFFVIGICIALTQGVLIRHLAPALGERRLVEIGLVMMAVGLACIPLAPAPSYLYVLGPVIAIGNGLAFPSFTSLFSRACEAEKAGELMGESQSMATAGRIAGSVLAGSLFDRLGVWSPFVIAGSLVFLTLVLFQLWRRTLLGEVPDAP